MVIKGKALMSRSKKHAVFADNDLSTYILFISFECQILQSTISTWLSETLACVMYIAHKKSEKSSLK